MEKLTSAAKAITQEADIETELKAKGFDEVLAMINDQNATIIVRSDGLSSSDTLKIQDAVVQKADIKLENIKIITVK